MKAILVLMSLISASTVFANTHSEVATHVPQAICEENLPCWFSSSLPFSTMLPFSITGDLTTIVSGDVKLVVENSREDAAYFVSSNGAVRTSRFENALQVIHAAFPQHEASDLEVAEWILSVE